MIKRAKRLFRHKWFKRIIFFFIAWICIQMIYITMDGFVHYKGNADVAIILGNEVYRDGSLSSWLKGRVDAALALYKAGKVKKIFASGGIGIKEDGYSREGDAMKKYLVQQGVPAEDVIADNAGQNTYLTAKNFIDWNKTHQYTSAIVVSQFYHITRSKYIMRKLGFKNVEGVSSEQYRVQDISSLLREVAAFYKYMFVY